MPTIRATPGRGPRRAAPPPPPAPSRAPPRIAALRGHGDVFLNHSAKRASNWLAGAAVYCGAAVAGAVWIGGGLFDAREAASALVDQAAVQAGFVADVHVEGVGGERLEEARAIVLPEGRRSVISTSPAEIRHRLMQLRWVDSVVVQRRWPTRIEVRLVHKGDAPAQASGRSA